MFAITERGVRLTVAALILIAQLAHLWVLPEEFITWPLRGLFFLGVAMTQGILAVLIAFGPRRSTIWFGVVFNALVVCIWLFTRTIGVPSLAVFIPEPIGWTDSLATASELVVVALLTYMRIRSTVNQRTVLHHA